MNNISQCLLFHIMRFGAFNFVFMFVVSINALTTTKINYLPNGQIGGYELTINNTNDDFNRIKLYGAPSEVYGDPIFPSVNHTSPYPSSENQADKKPPPHSEGGYHRGYQPAHNYESSFTRVDQRKVGEDVLVSIHNVLTKKSHQEPKYPVSSLLMIPSLRYKNGVAEEVSLKLAQIGPYAALLVPIDNQMGLERNHYAFKEGRIPDLSRTVKSFIEVQNYKPPTSTQKVSSGSYENPSNGLYPGSSRPTTLVVDRSDNFENPPDLPGSIKSTQATPPDNRPTFDHTTYYRGSNLKSQRNPGDLGMNFAIRITDFGANIFNPSSHQAVTESVKPEQQPNIQQSDMGTFKKDLYIPQSNLPNSADTDTDSKVIGDRWGSSISELEVNKDTLSNPLQPGGIVPQSVKIFGTIGTKVNTGLDGDRLSAMSQLPDARTDPNTKYFDHSNPHSFEPLLGMRDNFRPPLAPSNTFPIKGISHEPFAKHSNFGEYASKTPDAVETLDPMIDIRFGTHSSGIEYAHSNAVPKNFDHTNPHPLTTFDSRSAEVNSWKGEMSDMSHKNHNAQVTEAQSATGENVHPYNGMRAGIHTGKGELPAGTVLENIPASSQKGAFFNPAEFWQLVPAGKSTQVILKDHEFPVGHEHRNGNDPVSTQNMFAKSNSDAHSNLETHSSEVSGAKNLESSTGRSAELNHEYFDHSNPQFFFNYDNVGRHQKESIDSRLEIAWANVSPKNVAILAGSTNGYVNPLVDKSSELVLAAEENPGLRMGNSLPSTETLRPQKCGNTASPTPFDEHFHSLVANYGENAQHPERPLNDLQQPGKFGTDQLMSQIDESKIEHGEYFGAKSAPNLERLYNNGKISTAGGASSGPSFYTDPEDNITENAHSVLPGGGETANKFIINVPNLPETDNDGKVIVTGDSGSSQISVERIEGTTPSGGELGQQHSPGPHTGSLLETLDGILTVR